LNFPYKAILFDWAYTLVDLVSEDDRAAFLELMRFLKEKDVELPEFELIFSEYQDLFYGLIKESRQTHREVNFETVLRYLFFKFNIEIEGKTTWERILTVYYNVIHGVRLVYPEAKTTLEALSESGVRMAIISNTTNPEFIKEKELRQTGLRKFFEFTIFSSGTPYRKPHPSIFNAAISRMNVEPKNILFVGDDLKMDVIGAQSVGMPTAWLNRHGSALVENITPLYQITSLLDLLVIEPLEIAN
jgi:putative hydrolase of the HAD superfamily